MSLLLCTTSWKKGGMHPRSKTLPSIRRKFSVPTYSPDLFINEVDKDRIKFMELAVAIQNDDVDTAIQQSMSLLEENVPLQDPVTRVNVLHVATKSRNVELWEFLSNSEPVLRDIDATDRNGMTPLMCAAWYANPVAASYLLTMGADTTIRMPDTDKTALHFAAVLETAELAATILQYNSDVPYVNAVDRSGNTPLLLAITNDSPAAEELIRANADVFIRNVDTGRSVLHAAVVNHHHDRLSDLLDLYPQPCFVDGVDVNGDTPVMVAVRLGDREALEILLTAPVPGNLTEAADVSGDTSIHLAIKDDRPDLLRLLLRADVRGHFIDVPDRSGRTPLMYAIELQRLKCVRCILEFGPNYALKNPHTGDTILHSAASDKKWTALSAVLGIPGIETILNSVNLDGQTAFEVALAKGGPESVLAFLEAGVEVSKFLNENDESALFIAARESNFRVVQSLLLSDSYFALFHSDPNKTLQKLLTAEIQDDIYASDVFVLTGMETSGRGWDTSPDQTRLFRSNNLGQNIYHACALGESIEITVFIRSYCDLYKKDLGIDLDAKDALGNTPFMLAVQSGTHDVAKFLMKLGANLAKKNNAGESPLDAMSTHLPEFRKLITEVMDECVVIDTVSGLPESEWKILEVSCQLFCPPGYKQMYIISHIFTKLYSVSNFDILQHPVIESFTALKWAQLYYLIFVRFVLSLVTSVVFSAYLTIALCPLFAAVPPRVLSFFRWASFLLTIPSLTFAFPTAVARRKFEIRQRLETLLTMGGPACALVCLLGDPRQRFYDEVGAWGVLFCWCNILVYGAVYDRLGHQTAMFQRVLGSILSHTWVCGILILGFSFAFFTLFHRHFNFNNPYHSVLYTSVVMLTGTVSVNPVFSADQRLVGPDYESTERSIVTADAPLKNPAQEMQTCVVEGGFIVLFEIIVQICLVNMLLALAVKGGTELNTEGRIVRTKKCVTRVYEWEHFIDSRFYEVMSYLGLLWIVGVPPRLREHLQIPPKFYPLSDVLKNYPLEIQVLKSIAVDRKDIQTPTFDPLLRTPERTTLQKKKTRKRGKFWVS